MNRSTVDGEFTAGDTYFGGNVQVGHLEAMAGGLSHPSVVTALRPSVMA
jgi:hypothetical protein